MKVVVGLGNPGRRYENTRHNVGYELVAELARRHGASRPKVKFEAEFAEIHVNGNRTLLLAPQTYMNLSGRSVKQCARFFDLEPADVLVVCDDMNLELGRLRLRRAGSAGGQKGLNNIIQQLGTRDFPRLRIGIGRPPENVDPANYVLGRISKRERETLDAALQAAADGVETWIREGIEASMNRLNAPPG